jgi:hypothetical protein
MTPRILGPAPHGNVRDHLEALRSVRGMGAAQIDEQIRFLERVEKVRTGQGEEIVRVTVPGRHRGETSDFESKLVKLLEGGRYCYPYRKNGVGGWNIYEDYGRPENGVTPRFTVVKVLIYMTSSLHYRRHVYGLVGALKRSLLRTEGTFTIQATCENVTSEPGETRTFQ